MATKSSRKRRYNHKDELILEVNELLQRQKNQTKTVTNHVDFNKYKPKSNAQKELVDSIHNNDITIVIGEAGSGKTLLTLNESLRLVNDSFNHYHKLYLLKSVKGLEEEEEIGFLPGEADEKLELPFFSYKGNLMKILNEDADRFSKLKYNKIINYYPLYFMRGTSISNGIVILDEAQNVSLDILKTIMTRIEDTSKLIILGDEKQIDIKNKSNSGLRTIYDYFKKANNSNIGCVELKSEDIFRNPLIKVVNNVFEEIERNKKIFETLS